MFRVTQHFIDKKPFKYITERELFIFQYNNVTSKILSKGDIIKR